MATKRRTKRTTRAKPNERPDHAIHVDESDVDNDDELKPIRERFAVHQSFWGAIQSEALKDDQFVAGVQWEEVVKKEREEDRRPVLTYNLLRSFVRQITNKARQERTQVKVIPVESNRGADPRIENLQGTKDYSMADVYSGIIKNIEHVSRADQAYDTALKHAADHGFGYFYLMNEYSPTNPFVQELKIYRVKNSYGIYMDPDAQEADYRDAQDAFMFTSIRRSTFEAKWPEAAAIEFVGPSSGSSYEGWYDSDSLRLAQYFWIDWRDDEVLQLSNDMVVYHSDVENILDEMKQKSGIHIVKEAGKELRRKIKRPVCMWQKMTAKNVLERAELPFSAIPIFPVLGEEVMVDGRVRYESAIRHAKDAQKSYNYWRSAAAETVALAPRAPYILTAKQVKGHERLYENANTKNLPYLLYNHQDGVAPPQRNFPSNVAAAELQNAIQDGEDMQAIIGLHDASLGAESNEKSGKAILARQSQGSTSTYHFPDNLARAQEQMGRLMVEAIPKLYTTKRITRIRLPDDTDDFVEINAAVRDEDTGDVYMVHDINYGRYDVTIETGPSYSTQRQEAADLQIELLKVLGPDRAANIVHLIVKNLGVPGSDEVAAVLRKMLPDQLKSEEEKMADLPRGVSIDAETGQPMNEDGTPYQPPPTLEQKLMQKQQEIDELAHQASLAESQAKIAGSEADKAEAEADKKQAEAKIAQAQATMAELQAQPGGDQAAAGAKMMGEIQRIIQEALAEHEANESAHKEATAEQVADAVVDALERVKAYVDRRVGQPESAQGAAPGGGGSTGAGNQAQGAPPPPVVVVEGSGGSKKPNRIRFEYDEDGNPTEAIAESEPTVIRFKAGENGVTEAEVEEGDENQSPAA